MKLNDIICKNVKPNGKVQRLFDGWGLYLEVTKSGTKKWRMKYRFGNEKRLSIGSYPSVTLKEARERREEAKKLLEQGKDPSFEKQVAKKQAIADEMITFEIVAKEWHNFTKHKWTESHAKTILSRLERHLYPRIGKLPIKTITPALLLKNLKDIEEQGVYETTKRLRQYSSQIFKYAVVTEKTDKNPASELSGYLQTPKVEHHATIEVDEIPDFIKKLNNNEARLYEQTRLAIKLMLLTFVRTSELIEASWDEFDIENKIWLIPAERMKMKKEHFVPLSTQTIEILERLKVYQPNPNNLILPSPITPKKPISKNTILYGLYRLGYKGKATGHGFRALAMTAIKEKLGYRHEVVDRQLAHAHRNSIDAAYDRAQFLEERTQMMQEWADYVESLS